MPFGVPTVCRVPSNYSADCYLCMVPPIENGMSMAMNCPFLKLRIVLLCSLTMKTALLQTKKNRSHHLQEMQTTC